MIPASFDYVRATSLAQAIDLLANDPDATKIVAGGHTLIPTLKLRLASPSLLVDIGGINELKGIEIGDNIRIGAATTHAALLASQPLRDSLPIFREVANLIADPQVRNRGTIGGSLANADPSADWPAVALALGAELEIAGPDSRRRVAARDFFVDIMTTDLQPNEILLAVHILRPQPDMRFCYRKIRHPASGYAVVGVAMGVQLTDGVVKEAVIGVTGVAGKPFAPDAAISYLGGKPLLPEHINKAAALACADVEFLSDNYAPAEYRENLLKTEIARGLSSLARTA